MKYLPFQKDLSMFCTLDMDEVLCLFGFYLIQNNTSDDCILSSFPLSALSNWTGNYLGQEQSLFRASHKVVLR